MKISFDSKVCEENNLKLINAIALSFVKLCFYEKENPKEYIDKIFKEGWIYENNHKTLFHGPIYYLTSDSEKLLDKIWSESDNALPSDDVFEELAAEIQEVFPSGKMPLAVGGVVYYRGDKSRIATKLKKWWKVYNRKNEYTFDDIKEAATKYVAQKDEYGKNIKCCPYFILKEVKVENPDGSKNVEYVSDLSIMLENRDSENEGGFIGF